MPGAYLSGMRLRRAWPALEGAVGLWLWAQPLAKRSGSVSVWCGEGDLHRFVSWPVHVATMRKYRGAGEMNSISWQVERFHAETIWRQAIRHLGANELSRGSDLKRGGGQ
jgi:hypothetical protein